MMAQGTLQPPDTVAVSAIASLRARLWDAGFRPVAVYNPDAPVKSAGKAPRGEEWQYRARRDPPEAAVAPAEPIALNTGILCDGLRAIDIDIDDRQLAAQIRLNAFMQFGETSMRFRANSAKCLLLYRAAAGEPPKRWVASERGKIEILGKGQQFVAYGRHPSGAELQWSGDGPAEISIDQLPEISEDQLTAWLTWAASQIGAAPEHARHVNGGGNGAVSSHGLKAADALHVVAAVCAIPNTAPPDWEAWNRVGMAIWTATEGSEIGRAAWLAWSAQNPAFDAAATHERWDHYRSSPPTAIGAGTLFHMARRRPAEPPPPVSEDDYANGTASSAAPEAAPGAEIIQLPVPVNPYGVLLTNEPWEEVSEPRRPWVVAGYLLRRAVTVISGPGSAGKSSLMVAWSAALATNRRFGRVVAAEKRPLKVAVYNVEDDLHEQRRRYSAMCRQLEVSIPELMRNLYLILPQAAGTLFHRTPDGMLLNTQAMEQIEQFAEEWQPDLMLFDPFVELHEAEENDNTAVREVVARFRRLADRHNMAVGVLHHARKGLITPGDPDSLRGASAIVGTARVVLTVTTMTDEEATELGIPLEHRRDYFRLDDAKKNYSRITDAEWFERLEYRLDNGDDETGEAGDLVAVPYPWTPKKPSFEPDVMVTLAAAVAQGAPVGPWSPRLSDDQRSFRHALIHLGITGPQAQKATLRHLLTSGMVEIGRYRKGHHSARDPYLGLRTRDGEPRAVRWVDGSEIATEGGQNG